MSDGQQTYMQMLEQWMELSASLKRLTAEERALREQLFNGAFPNPVEGANNYELPDGRVIKGTYNIRRNVNQERATSLPKKLQNKYFRTKLHLNTTAFREAEEEDLAALHEVIEEKPGMPSLAIKEAPVQ